MNRLRVKYREIAYLFPRSWSVLFWDLCHPFPRCEHCHRRTLFTPWGWERSILWCSVICPRCDRELNEGLLRMEEAE